MAVYSIRGIARSARRCGRGRVVTERIWIDVEDHGGYVGHELSKASMIHLLVIGRSTSRERADDVLGHPVDDPKAKQRTGSRRRALPDGQWLEVSGQLHEVTRTPRRGR